MDYLIYNLAGLPSATADISLLPPEEQALAATRNERWLLVRSLLRLELTRRCALPPQDIHFTYGEQGKPEFPAQPFNLSHSRDLLCLAFHHKAIGVDIEYMRPRHFERLAPRFMCDVQLQAFLERGCQKEEFYACWCAAEALVKHAGDTMWHALNYPFTYRQGRIICRFEAAPTVHLFTPAPDFCGAVAYTPE